LSVAVTKGPTLYGVKSEEEFYKTRDKPQQYVNASWDIANTMVVFRGMDPAATSLPDHIDLNVVSTERQRHGNIVHHIDLFKYPSHPRFAPVIEKGKN
jgi:predicted RecB family endonuclease